MHDHLYIQQTYKGNLRYQAFFQSFGCCKFIPISPKVRILLNRFGLDPVNFSEAVTVDESPIVFSN
jgi:hypothetical protein